MFAKFANINYCVDVAVYGRRGGWQCCRGIKKPPRGGAAFCQTLLLLRNCSFVGECREVKGDLVCSCFCGLDVVTTGGEVVK